MSNNVTIKPETNKVELTDQRRNITVTNNRTGTSINLTQTDPQVVLINTPGPQGATGVATTSGSFSGSFQGDGSGLTGIVASGSIDSSSFAETSSLALSLSPKATASHALTAVSASYALYAVTTSHETTYELSSSLAETASFAQSGRGEFGGTFSGSFDGNFTSGSIETNDFTFSGDVLNVLGDVFVQGTLDASTKNFKIQHPTMPGYYLVHSSLEGPERGMYVRGKLKTSDTIHLPDYWNELTDDVDITVQLTPIGNSCIHFVKSVNKQEIIVGCDCGAPHCYYIIHAQRYNEGKFNILQPKRTKSL